MTSQKVQKRDKLGSARIQWHTGRYKTRSKTRLTDEASVEQEKRHQVEKQTASVELAGIAE